MDLKLAAITDAPIIHDLMMKAFWEYKDEIPPSSALEETIESIQAALSDQELSYIAYLNDEPVGMVRFKLFNEELYFYRLSVLPEKRGLGIAKELLKQLEIHAKNNNISKLMCKVRKTLPKNIQLYQSLGYEVIHEENLPKPNGITIKVVTMVKYL